MAIVLLVGIFLALFSVSKVQHVIVHSATSELSERYNTEILVGDFRYKLFNRICIQDVYVEDLEQDTLFYAQSLTVKFKFWELFHKNIVVSGLEIRGLHVNLKTDSAGQHNFDFLAHERKNRKREIFDLQLQITNVALLSSSFNYHNQSAPPVSENVFSSKNVELVDLNAEFGLNYFSADSVNAAIESFSFRDRSGLELADLQAQLIANRQSALIPHIRVELPNSHFYTEDISLNYNKMTQMSDWASDAVWNIPNMRASLTMSDLAPFMPIMKTIDGIADFEGKISGSTDALRVDKVTLDYDKLPLIRGEADFNGLPVIDETFVHATVVASGINRARIQDVLSDYKNEPYLLPKTMELLEEVEFDGTVTGFLGNLVAYGSLATGLGSISTDLLLETDFAKKEVLYSGRIGTKKFKLGELLGTEKLGDVAFSLKTNGQTEGMDDQKVTGVIDANIHSLTVKDYEYENITMKGNYSSAGFEGTLNVEDENLVCAFDGLFDFTQELPVINFDVDVDKMKLNELNLVDDYENSELSFETTINIIGNSLDDVNGYIVVDSLCFITQKGKWAPGKIYVSSEIDDSINRFAIQSDILKVTIVGNYQYSTLQGTFSKYLAQYLPSLIPNKSKTKYLTRSTNNNFTFHVYVSETSELSDMLNLPFMLPQTSVMHGFVDEAVNKFDMQIGVPNVVTEKYSFDDFTFRFGNLQDLMKMTAYVRLVPPSKQETECFLKVLADNDSIDSHINWVKNDTVVNKGALNLNTVITQQKNKPILAVNIEPSSVIINDSVWSLSESFIDIIPDGNVQIKDFKFESSQQHMAIDGVLGRSQSDSLYINLKNLELNYVLDLIPTMNPNVTFGGIATGVGYIYSALNKPVFDANVFLKDGTFNGTLLGDLDANANWDRVNKQVLMSGILAHNDDVKAYAQGVLIPAQDSINFIFDGKGVNLGFINRYTQDILKDLSGEAYGKIRLYGNIKEKRTHISGDVLVKNGSLGVEELNTRYYLNDTISLSEKQIKFANLDITDAEGNKGVVNGAVNHDGSFHDFDFKINVACKNFIALDTDIQYNDAFFGKIYASGQVNIFGDEDDVTINVKAKSEPNSNFNVSLASASSATDNSFISFKSDTEKSDTEQPDEDEDEDDGVRMRLILQAEVTPDAELQVIVDPKMGDAISGRGVGNVRFELTPEDEMMLQGNYALLSGSYTFILQNMIRREFKIAQGSSISWIGDPFNAQVDIRALYNTTASLRDLKDEDLLSVASRVNVPVSCVLNLTGELMRPNIKFDLDLPNSDETIKERVKNIISTDEMMNRQIIYLLVFSKFYTPEYLQTSTSYVGTNEAYSILTSTVTSQINNWISQLTTDFSFGFNIRAFDYKEEGASQEYETEFLYQPNNRLAINGNFGYRNDEIKKVYGDVDMEYMLDRAGKLRAKAYTHSVDRYEYRSDKSKQTMQGVGVVYKEDFNTLNELFSTYADWFRKVFLPEKSKQEKNKTQKTDEE